MDGGTPLPVRTSWAVDGGGVRGVRWTALEYRCFPHLLSTTPRQAPGPFGQLFTHQELPDVLVVFR